MTLVEKELTTPVQLCTPEGRLNRAAHGWARQPIVDTSGIKPDAPGAGRNKRWEYWCFLTPQHIIALTVSSIDYLSSHEVWVFERATGKVCSGSGGAMGEEGLEGAILPANVEDGPARGALGDVRIDIDQIEGGTRLRAWIPGAEFDLVAARPAGHERLAVVVPWSDDVFQYTVKDVSRPASGSLTVGGQQYDITDDGKGGKGEAWAILDHGRGRWPPETSWNWGAGSGRATDGRVVGLQVGDKWTDGTGSTENAFLIGTKLYKIGQLKWTYDTKNYMGPWSVKGGGLSAVLTPFYNKQSELDAGFIASKTDQCFGHWKGSFERDGEKVTFDNLVGFAEDVWRKW